MLARLPILALIKFVTANTPEMKVPLVNLVRRGSRAVLMIASLMGLASLAVEARPRAAVAPAAASSGPVAVPAYRQANRVAVLTIDGEIDRVTLTSLERRVARAVKEGADAIVFDIKTPGGELSATLDICHLIRTECPANTVAWINPQAFSAGTIISLACREIVVAPEATFGDAAPIQAPAGFLMQMAPTERAKIEAPLIAEVVASARRNHYDENLVRAFVSVGVELWLIENIQTGDRICVDRAEYQTVFNEDPPARITSNAAPMVSGQRLRPKLPFSIEPPAAGPLVDPAEITRNIELAQTLPPREALTEADRGQWKLIAQVDSADQLLTVKADEAVFYGLASAVIANDQQLKAYFGAKDIARYDASWSEGLVRFLCSFWVRAILIVVFLVGLFVELAAPGVGVFGAAAGVALLLLIGAPALAGLAQWWDILLIIAGLVLVLAELFLIPGTGIPGAIGVVCLLVGLVGTFVSGDIGSAQGQSELWTGLLGTLMSVFVAGMVMWFVSKHIHSMPYLNRIVLNTELSSAGNQFGSAAGLLESMGEPAAKLRVGERGLAETDLRPAGKAAFDGRLLDVQSSGGYIDKGSPVRIVSIGRLMIEVEELT